MRAILGTLLFSLTCSSLLFAQAGGTSHTMILGIIVTPTMEGAQSVSAQLRRGTDFSVLAKEKSIDASASDGGYIGDVDPDRLRVELRNAAQELKVGELSGIVQIPSGFVILKALPAAPTTSDLNPKRISALVATGAIHYGASVAGLNEADAAFLEYAKQGDWNCDLPKMCQLRKEFL